jgi:amino acid adenylation domain-containing protein
LQAFVTLLYRYSGQDDIVVGTPVANRNRREIEGLFGFFVNTLVLRTDLSGNPSFEQLLGRVKEVALGAYAHQDLPFEQLVEALQPTRDLSYTPLFQVMFALDDALVPSVKLPELAVSSYSVEIGTAKFDLTLSMENTADGLVGVWEYNADLFDEVTIAKMAGHFQTLLEALAANAIQPISQLPLLTQRERHQLLVEWNNTTTDYPFDKCIHQLFEEQVALTPDAVALVFVGEQLTYGELNRRANKLAHYLQSLGVGPEVLVGICVERSFDMIIGLLGILKAGGAYVPIDPAYPTDRIAYMLDDSRLPVLLTQQKLVASLPEHQARVVCLDADWEEISVMPELPPQSDVTPENLAYVIYTSGSTGKPKGVLVAHRGLCNLALAQIKLFDVQPESRVLQFASLSFDASISEIVMAVCAGATLCLGTLQSLQPGQPLVRLLQEHSITHLTLVPSALAALPNEELPALQNIIVAGEPCPTSLVAQWAVGRRFFNAYGPTESTVCATVAQCFEGMDVLPIGRPIDNTQVYILDRYLQPVPIGVPGELHIASVGLARGYLNRPDLTAEKFIPNPFSNESGSHLYKTGDKARYLPDGNIEFLGRIDNQVKVRGFRIELGEIEALLSQHPGVRETAVIARVNSAGDNQLVAYIVPHQEPAPTVSDLRRFLKEQLPNYMVPSAFVMLCALPLTPNGKVDHKSLPAPDLNSLLQKSDFVAPGTPTEELVASIWAKVLGVEQVGINDNFFELGGHSLLATQLLSQVSDTCGVELPLSKLFEAPTVASISNYIEAISWANQSLKTSNNTVNNREEVEF